MKAVRYLNSGTDSICCSLLAVIMEQMFLLLCWVFFIWVVAFLFYRLVFSTCILDKLVISSLKKKKKATSTSDKFIFMPSQPIYSICLHLTSLLMSSVIWAFFQTY